MQEEKSGLPELFKQYPEDQYNHLLPTETYMENVGPMQKLSAEVLRFDLERHTYEPEDAKGKRALNAIGLAAAAAAAGISFGEPKIEPQRPETWCRFSIPGIIRKPDGTFRVAWGTYMIDLEADKKHGMSEKRLKNRAKFMVQLCETGAMDRVIRKFLALGLFTPEELKKPFVIRRVDFAPDVSDPQVKQFLLQQADGAISQLYPPSRLSAAKQIACQEIVDVETGEINQAKPEDDLPDAVPKEIDPIEDALMTFDAVDRSERNRLFVEACTNRGVDFGSKDNPTEIRKLYIQNARAAYHKVLEGKGNEV